MAGYINAPHQELWERTRSDLRYARDVLRSVRVELARVGAIPEVPAPGDWPSLEREMIDAVRALASKRVVMPPGLADKILDKVCRSTCAEEDDGS